MLTIVTAVRNNAEGLGRTLCSIADQTAVSAEYELIVVDGRSTDNTVEVAESYTDALACQYSLISEVDSGIYDAMNKGWRRSAMPYVMFLNSGDCLTDSDVIKDLIGELKEHLPVWLVAHTKFLDASGAPVRVSQNVPHHFLRHALGRRMHAHPSSIFGVESLRALGGYSLQYGHAGDFDLVLRTAQLSPAHPYDRILVDFEYPGISAREVDAVPEILHRVRVDRLALTGVLASAERSYSRFFARRWAANVDRRKL